MSNRISMVPYDPVDYLKTPEDIAEYIHAAIEDGNEQVMLDMMQDVARAVMEMAET